MKMDRIDPGPVTAESAADDALPLQPWMAKRAEPVAAFLKALSHEGRLMILCHLAAGERSVSELEELLGLRQAAVSQQLARLRLEGLVTTRREGKAIFYRIGDPRALALLQLLPGIFASRD